MDSAIELRDPVIPGETQPGDLVFVTGQGPLGEMIEQLDGSPYSHVGVVLDAGRMISARTGPPADPNVELRWSSDIGGVRIDTFEALWAGERNLVIGRTAPGSGREQAPERMEAWLDSGQQDRSAFSFVKLFAVATGLRGAGLASAPDDGEALRAAAERVARSWAVEHQGTRPSFFCAEAVAAAFGQQFARDRFPPPLVLGAAAAGPGDPAWWADVERLAGRLFDEAPSPGQILDVVRMVGTVAHRDRAFLGSAAERLVEILRAAARRKRLEAVERELAALTPSEPHARRGTAAPAAGPLPTALVTPRMLLRADWVQWLAPVEPSG